MDSHFKGAMVTINAVQGEREEAPDAAACAPAKSAHPASWEASPDAGGSGNAFQGS